MRTHSERITTVFVNTVIRLAAEHNTTPKDIGLGIGIHQPSFSHMKAGRRTVSLEQVCKLCKRYRIPITDIIKLKP